MAFDVKDSRPSQSASGDEGFAAALLALKKDLAAELKNDPKGIDQRRADFKDLRKQFEALIKFRRNEDPNAFELRKLSLIQQLNEVERFVVEAEDLLATWTTTDKERESSGTR